MGLVKALKNVGSYYRQQQPINRYLDDHGRLRARYSKVRVNFRVRKTFGIIPNKYKLKELLEKLQTEIRALDLDYKTLKCCMTKILIELLLLEINENS